MSPLFLVGIIFLLSGATLADVKHVLDNQNVIPSDVNNLASQQSPNGDFWWMRQDSPLKAAYDFYKKQPPTTQVQLDLHKNPFLNGQIQDLPSNPNNNNNNPTIDLSKNPFLNGVVTTGSGANIPKTDGFLGVQPSQPFQGKNKQPFATTHPLDNKKPISTNHPLENNQNGDECKGSGYICVDADQCVDGIVNKNGQGILQVRTDVHYCKPNQEVCCRLSGTTTNPNERKIPLNLPNFANAINDLSQVSIGKSSVPGGSSLKFASGGGFSSGSIQILPDQDDNAKPTFNSVGESGHQQQHEQSSSKSIRDTSQAPSGFRTGSSTIDYSNVDFGNEVRFGSPDFKGPDYLPPRVEQPTTTRRPPIVTPSPSPTGSSAIYIPSTTPSRGGYSYSTPTPQLTYPTRPNLVHDGSDINVDYVSTTTTRRPITNGYLPPTEQVPGDSKHNPTKVPYPTTPNTDNVPQPGGIVETTLPVECPAAMKCVQEIYCSADGYISPQPVILTKEQEFSKVPTSSCLVIDSQSEGRCCRDPNYVDPWPSANLVNGVDDGKYAEDPNLGQYNVNSGLNRKVRSGRHDQTQTRNDVTVTQPTCGLRHKDTTPLAVGPLDVNFAEISWQAMILRDSNRSLLCGGAIIRKDVVLTAAHCLDGLPTSDILIKGGEWKLGIDEEPLPFQIVKVSAIVRHPEYKRGGSVGDLALLVLQEKLRPAKNIGTICLPQPNQIPTENCIATGWGKRILQLHAKGAIMHSIDINIMDNQQCQQTLSEKFANSLGNFSPNTLCGFSDVDQCKVDYGSALACQTGDRYTLSGIYSWDTGCKESGQIGGYIAPDVDWIESTLAKPLQELKRLDTEFNAS